MNLDDEPGINEKIKKKNNNKTKTRNENHSLLNSNKVTHPKFFNSSIHMLPFLSSILISRLIPF